MRLGERIADERFLYFAYGSNMLTRRLRKRTPSVQVADTGFVPGHRLTFDKASKGTARSSGKCEMEATGIPTDRVYGVLFTILKTEKEKLDKAEGALGDDPGYRKAAIDVTNAAVTRSAVV